MQTCWRVVLSDIVKLVKLLQNKLIQLKLKCIEYQAIHTNYS